MFSEVVQKSFWQYLVFCFWFLVFGFRYKDKIMHGFVASTKNQKQKTKNQLIMFSEVVQKSFWQGTH